MIIWLPLPECFASFIPHENSKTIGTNYLTKGNRQSILVVVGYDTLMEFPIDQFSTAQHAYSAISYLILGLLSASQTSLLDQALS
jgi:hypothetical protein